MTVTAPAKINLGLHVLRVRPDGYRDIDTVFVRIPWCDEVSYVPAEGRSMTCNDPALPTGDGNLCMKAALLLAERTGRTDGWRLHLEKRVPYGAGLGSGSSDAAAVLRMLGQAWDVAEPTLTDVAAAVGSDVPFFLGPPVARGTGRGEELQPLEWQCPYPLVVAVPPVHVPTGEAYQMVQPRDQGRAELVPLIKSNDHKRWRTRLVNDFQEPVAGRWSKIRAALDMIREDGALYAAMSGSGSSVFGLCDSEEHADALADRLRQSGCRVWAGFAEGA
ncbi:MAG: 4-(cytidine 5'-diphospho)-2-C-methyl-D-erythritol kinase [Rhodothermales bacterium]|nr:4-(cytidine 5'-diphospho)-2-C-methyl-D-erythritol kinase [Rhodothermales bacterium]MBO6781085.1 4-(cytidine 5'-diphospho)-2-C-methyl-D-erythritol kinase [Rhodothermales bacterium]